MKNRKAVSISLLTVLVVIYVLDLIVSNLTAGKPWQFASNIVLTAGIVTFPVVYILDDVIPEVYGFRVARQVIWIGFAANLIVVLVFLITLALPAPGFFDGQGAYQTVLGITPRILLASFAAYLVGAHSNAWILVRIKRLTGERFLWVRTIGSTLVGESLDSIIFMLIAFYGVFPADALPGLIAAQTGFKIAYEILATPITYLVVNTVKRAEGEVGLSPAYGD